MSHERTAFLEEEKRLKTEVDLITKLIEGARSTGDIGNLLKRSPQDHTTAMGCSMSVFSSGFTSRACQPE